MGGLLGCMSLNMASCAATTACQCLGGVLPNNSSSASRFIFIVLFALTSFGAWGLNVWAPDILKWIPVIKVCEGDKCMGAMAVYRITFALSIFHLFFSLVMIGWNRASDFRSHLHNGFWVPKFVILLALIAGSFFIPNSFFSVWGWISLFGSSVFVLVQLVLLVDFAHTWSNSWTSSWEETQHRIWVILLTGFTGLFYAGVAALTIIMYVVMCSECDSNVLFVTINLCFVVLYTFLSIHPKVQEGNGYRSGLLQSSVVSLFSTYMVFSAIMSQPESWGCNPWSARSSNRTQMIIGAVFVIISVCYSAFSTSRNIVSDDEEDTTSTSVEAGNDTTVNSTEETSLLSTGSGGASEAIAFNASLFHLAFATGAMYIAMLLTSWQVVTQENSMNIRVDSSIASVWVKLVSSWVVSALYVWTVVAPILLPNRQWD